MDKKILCIIRASTEKQETESQKKELVEYCQKLGYSVEEMAFIEVAGASARKLNEKYIQMLEDIKTTLLSSSTITAVAIWHLNRLGRVESKLHEMKEFFVNNKIQVYCKNPSFCLLDEDGKEDATGGLAFSVFASMVKLDTDEMFAKMQRGRNRNKEMGIYYGGKVKFGYTLDETNHFIINPDEASTIKLIFEMYATGRYSIYSLVEELRAMGITKKGQKITFDIIRNALSDEAYYTNKQPIISKELFDKCKELKMGNAVALHTKESVNVNFAVGLLKCECGQNFIASGDFYMCYSKRRNSRTKDKVECKAPTIRREIMDELLWLITRRLHQKFLMEQNTTNVDEYKAQLATINLKLSQCDRDIEAAKARAEKLSDDYYIEGGMNEAQYKKRLLGITSKQKEAEEAKKYYQKEAEDVARIIKQMELPINDKYVESLMLLDMNEEDVEDRKKIKEIMFTHIERASISQFYEGTHKCYEITIVSKSGLSFVFIYDSWVNSHKKGECNLFYEGLPFPLYKVNGHTIEFNLETMKMIDEKVGLPTLNNTELGEAAVNYIKRNKD